MPDVPLLGQSPQSAAVPTIYPENASAWQQLGEIRETNLELVKQLAMMNIGIDPMSVIQLRFSAILDTLFPPYTLEGQAKQIACELAFEKVMGEALGEMRRNAVTAQLQAGAQVPKEMLEKMARAQGIPAGLDGSRRR